MANKLTKVLVANRGEIACRILRACSEAGISSLAIYADNDANSLFVELADEAVMLQGDSIASTYLDQTQILKIAADYAVDAIHPGLGFYRREQTLLKR